MTDVTSRLIEERSALRAFVLLLETEQKILTSDDTSPLLELANTKSSSALRLTTIISARRNALHNSGYPDMNSWLQLIAPTALPVWLEIRELAERAQQMNLTNGELIQTRMRHNQKALGVLHSAASDSAGLYGRDGQPNLPNSSRTLGSV